MSAQRIVKLAPPDISDGEIDEVVKALKSGWITTGPVTKRFEKEISAYCGTDRTACLGSATAALELTLRVLGVKAGDEVITTAYTYTASASSIAHAGADIVLVDVEKGKYNIDYDKIEESITEKTKAIIPVDIAGVMCDYDRLKEIVEKKRSLFKPESKIQKALGRVAIVTDGAHSLGAVRNGVKSGCAADFTCFSFHAVKNLTTAEGGAATWLSIDGISDDEIYNEYMLLSLHGQNKDAFAKVTLGGWEYDIKYLGYKYNMTDIAASIGSSQLSRYDDMLKRREEITRMYDAALQDLPCSCLRHIEENAKSSMHIYLVRVDGYGEEERNKLFTKMAEAGITCAVHYKPLPMMTAYKNLGFDIKDYPNAYEQYKNEITLPLHTLMSDEDVQYVIEQFASLIKK